MDLELCIIPRLPHAIYSAASCPFCPTSEEVTGQPTVESLPKPVRAPLAPYCRAA